MTEIELAQKFIDYLDGMYDLYFEVEGIDIVGKSDHIVITIEVKKQLNFKVIEQAYSHLNTSHYSYIAVPSKKGTSHFAIRICEMLGIGVLFYSEHPWRGSNVYEVASPHLNRHANVKWAKKLTENSPYKKTTAGAKCGETKTAFSIFTDDIRTFVKRHNGCELKDVFHGIGFGHYGSMTSAKSCITRYIDSGVIKNIRREGKKIFYVE